MGNSPADKARKRQRVNEIVNHFTNAIVSGEFKPGEKLPASETIRAQFNAHTGIIQAARTELVSRDLVEVKHFGLDVGTYVK